MGITCSNNKLDFRDMTFYDLFSKDTVMPPRVWNAEKVRVKTDKHPAISRMILPVLEDLKAHVLVGHGKETYRLQKGRDAEMVKFPKRTCNLQDQNAARTPDHGQAM